MSVNMGYMKILYLMRHAKSSWEDTSIADIDRSLNSRGRRTAPLMGKLMVSRALVPELIISSPAKRARETTMLVTDATGSDAEIIFDERIYEANPLRLLVVTAAIPGPISTAMLVGHNPGMEGFIWFLTGKLEPMPTAALAILELDIERWNDIRDNCGTVADVIRPKDEVL